MSDLLSQDLRSALRQLRLAPGFAAVPPSALPGLTRRARSRAGEG